jgi:hypothetical protein
MEGFQALLCRSFPFFFSDGAVRYFLFHACKETKESNINGPGD